MCSCVQTRTQWISSTFTQHPTYFFFLTVFLTCASKNVICNVCCSKCKMLRINWNTSFSSCMLWMFSQALVQSEHVLTELARQRERLEKELALEQEKIAQARDAARSESKREKEELAQMVSTFSRMDYSCKCRPANLHSCFTQDLQILTLAYHSKIRQVSSLVPPNKNGRHMNLEWLIVAQVFWTPQY